MKEFLWHALGLCGEHWHPNLINITALVLMATLSGYGIGRKIKSHVQRKR
jgi:hypothetical protein